MRVLVCVKRSADIAGQVVLTEDGTALDGRYSGYAMSDHELSALEIAAGLGEANQAQVTVFTLGEQDANEQLRYALSVGANDAVHVVASPDDFGSQDVAREIAAVVNQARDQGEGFDLILVGNDSADAGNFQTGIRLSYLLDCPVVAGVQQVEIHGEQARMKVDTPAGTETYEVGLPAIACVLEGGVVPRFPSLRGRMRARRAPVDSRTPAHQPVGTGALGLSLPPQEESQVTILGEGAEAAPAVVEVLREAGVVS